MSMACSMYRKGGIIVLKKKLDREMSQTFKLKVEITDGKHTVTTPVDIHVEDANDNPPHFSRNIYVFNVTEEPEIGHVIGKVSAEDPDHGPGGFIEFSIRGGDGSEAFTINNDGVISVIRSHTLLDREHNEKINLRVLAADKGIPPQQSEVEVVLRLSDVNDNAPEFSSRIYHGTVSEDDASPHPQVVLMDLPINATDYDKDLANRNIRFSLSGDGSDIFQMDPFRADIIVNRVGHIDCESRCEFNLVITATDQGGKGRSSTSKLHIAVKDQNDNYPEFVSPLRFSALTDVLIGTRIGQLRARDRDATQPNNQVIYILREGGYGKFTVDFDSGDLYVADNLEREPVMEDYVLQIEAIDGGRSRLSRKANVTISVPYNHGPVILKNSTDLRVKEDVPVGTVFGRMSATDQDILKGKRQKLTFHTSNAYVPLIVTPGGELKTAAPLDRETQGAYVFKVIVHDNGRPPKSSETEIKVIVEDTNDNAPRFSSAVYSGSIVEDDWIPKPGQKVTMRYNISATDDDLSAVYQNIHFSLKGNGSEMFDIDPRTAEVTVSHKGIGHINREAQENFTMKIVARDSGGSGLSSEADLVIHIVDINDEAPVFRQRGQELTVQNSVRAGHVIGHVSAIDRDSEAPNNKIFYTLENDGLGKFKVDPESGALIALQGLFFQPRQRSYLLRVGAMDLGYPSHKATDTVTVKMLKTKFNDYKPEFHGQTIFYTREEVPIGTIIGKLTTVDKDIEPGEKVTLTITADGKVPFKIDSKTGDIRTTDRLDADHGVMAYTFTVKANDNGVPPQEAEAFIGVILEDINDNPPQFTQSTYHHSVSAIFPPYTTVATPFAYDDVDTHNSVYHYDIRGPDAGLYLYIDRDTGIVRTTDKVSQLNTTQVEYTLVATDVYNHQLTAQAKLVVDIYHSTMNECCCIQPCP